jgi:hypothetical protein
MQRESDVCESVCEAGVLVHGSRRCRTCYVCVCAQSVSQRDLIVSKETYQCQKSPNIESKVCAQSVCARNHLQIAMGKYFYIGRVRSSSLQRHVFYS